MKVGSRFHERAPAVDGGMDKETVITGLDPPNSYSYKSEYSNGFREHAYVELEEVAGRTRVRPMAEIDLPGVPQEQESAVVEEMQLAVASILQNLKDYLEQTRA